METMMLKELEELWLKLTEGAREMLLGGRVTLSDLTFFSGYPRMPVGRMRHWVEETYPNRCEKLVTRIPWIGVALKTFEAVKGLLRRVAEESVEIFKAFMSSELTLEQLRYAYATNMGPRSLRHFCNIDHPEEYRYVRERRRHARKAGASARARCLFNRQVRQARSTLFMDMSEPGMGIPTIHIFVAGYGTDGRPLAASRIEF